MLFVSIFGAKINAFSLENNAFILKKKDLKPHEKTIEIWNFHCFLHWFLLPVLRVARAMFRKIIILSPLWTRFSNQKSNVRNLSIFDQNDSLWKWALKSVCTMRGPVKYLLLEWHLLRIFDRLWQIAIAPKAPTRCYLLSKRTLRAIFDHFWRPKKRRFVTICCQNEFLEDFLEDFGTSRNWKKWNNFKFLKNDQKSIPNQKPGTVDRLVISNATRWSGLFGQGAAGWWLDKHLHTQPARHLTWLHKPFRNAPKTRKKRKKICFF